jgi:predicted RNA-binding protein (virulence factor B family)
VSVDLKIGQMNDLEVLREVDFGFYLDGGEEFGDILIPRRYAPKNCKPGDILHVIVYNDSEDRLIATTETPFAVVGEFAILKVISLSPIGAFLDWGLSKDLLLPLGEMKSPVELGEKVLVAVFLDEKTNRVAASSRIGQFLEKGMPPFKIGEELEIFVTEETNLGYKVIIENFRLGFVPHAEAPGGLEVGEIATAYLKKILEDGKVDLTLNAAPGKPTVDTQAAVLQKLTEKKGFIPIPQDADEEMIFKMFGMSEKNFKKAVGALHRKRMIEIGPKGIKRVKR